jgi:hypothetical protein
MTISKIEAIKLASDKVGKVEYWISPDGDGYWSINYNGEHLFHESVMTREQAEETHNMTIVGQALFEMGYTEKAILRAGSRYIQYGPVPDMVDEVLKRLALNAIVETT